MKRVSIPPLVDTVQEFRMKVIGYVIRRRCLGKWLAFADIAICNENDNDDDDDNNNPSATFTTSSNTDKYILSVVFQRESPSWNKVYDDTFPTKSSKLPYGSKIELEICEGPKPYTSNDNSNDDDNDKSNNATQSSSSSSYCFEVHQWKMISNPRDHAMELAMTNTSSKDDIGGGGGIGGISCSIYLKERGKAFSQYHQFNSTSKDKNKMKSSKDKNTNGDKDGTAENRNQHDSTATTTTTNDDDNGGHGDPRAKALRAKLFAKWILDTFNDRNQLSSSAVDVNDDGVDSQLLLQQPPPTTSSSSSAKPSTVLDIAGGKGNLSVELALQGHVQCTIIDPMIRRRQQHQQQQQQSPTHNTSSSSSSSFLPKRQVKQLRKINAPHPYHVATYFNQTTFMMMPSSSSKGSSDTNIIQEGDDNDEEEDDKVLNQDNGSNNGGHDYRSGYYCYDGGGETMIQNAKLCVGLHPDECTEDIVDVALRYNKSFAIVPCCVFADLYPHREVVTTTTTTISTPAITSTAATTTNETAINEGDGTGTSTTTMGSNSTSSCGDTTTTTRTKVRNYDQFIQYLLQKDSRIQLETLPFDGKNQVLYLKNE